MTTIQIIGIIALALLGGFIFYCLYDIHRFNRSNKKKLILLALVSLTGLQAWATSKTVTYTFIAEHANNNVNRWTLTFMPSNNGFNYHTGEKTVTIENTSNTTGFTVELDDGLRLVYSQDAGHLTFWGFQGFYLNGTNDGGNSCLTLTSSHYYVTHVKMANTSGSVLTGQATPWTDANAQLDVDVDMVTQYGGPSNYRSFSATFSYLQVFGQLTVTYGDPRDYAITYTNAVNGQNGVTNNNPTTYNVTTNTFQITAPTRTGYTLGTVTYTDGQHPNATPVNLIQSPMTIYRGEAATRKAITFNASWTPNTYTVTLDNQSATTPGTESVTATYNAAMPAITIPTKTGYTFGGYYIETNGGGTQYYNADGTSAHNWDIAEATTLYAQWTANSYTVHFDANYDDNGIVISGTMSNQSFTYDQGVLNANAFTRTGYTFVNWNTQADGGGTTYTNQQASPNITPDDGATVTLYAQWSVTPWTGSGDSEQDPYLILYASQLVKISNDVNGGNQYSGTYFKLGNDIDMDGVAFDGIGNGSGSNQFYGNFNGDNKAISNVTIDKPNEDYVGFFSQPNSGTIKNLILNGASITGQYYVGVIAAYSASIANNHYRNCSVTKDGNTYTNNIGTNNGDVAGARSVHTLTLPGHFTATSAETVTYNQGTYYASNVEVTLTLEQGCYITDDVTVTGTSVTENGDGTWTFIMPAADATVSATVMEYKITVNDDTDTTNYNVPFSSQYCKQGAHSQFIIPAADLDSIQWGAINKMTFYSNMDSVSWENVVYDVYFAEVGFTTFKDGDWISDYTITHDFNGSLVYSGGVSVSDSTMEITLSSPFPYYGGNLLVYFEENNNAEYNGPEMKWYGKTQTAYTAVYRLGDDSYRVQFLPKITFGYTPAPSCIPPTALTIGEVTNHTAAISWTANSNETAWHVYYSEIATAPADDISLDDVIAVETTPTNTFTGLDASTKYYFWVRGNCGNDGYSSWAGSDFTTEIACAAPTRLNVSDIASTSATLSWTSDGDDFDVTYTELPVTSSEIKYDNGVYESCIPNRYAGILLPAGSYTESNIRKISVYDSYMATGAVCPLWICYGTTAPDMANPIYTDSVIFAGINAMIDIPIDVAVDNAQNLWVVMHSDGDRFSLPICTDHSGGEATANGRWYSENGSEWSNNDYWETYYLWMIRVTLDGGGYTWIEQTCDTNSYHITGLNANKDYAVRVRRVCGDGDGVSTWSGTFFTTCTKVFTTAGDWATASNWSPEDVPTINDNVVISADATIGSGCVAQAHQITFEGTPTPTLTLADGGTLVCDNPANVTVQKSIGAYSVETGQGTTNGWNFIASPITEAYTPAGSMVANTYDLYRLNPANAMWENFKNNQHSDFDTLANGQGYLYANSEDVTLIFTGTTKPYDNSYSVPLSAGFNLVGNPYTFDAYVNCCYFKLNSTRTGVEFVNENFAIPPCESVVIKATADSSVVFTNVEQPWTASTGNNGSLSIALTQANTRGNAVLDKVLISFNEGSQLEKFYFGTQDANIYIPVGHEEYAIAYSEGQGEMPLNFEAAKSGEYTLSVNTEGVEMAYLHLIDNMTGADVDLLALRQAQVPASYTFNAKTTDYESRFKLVFATICGDADVDNETFAFISNGHIIVNGEGTLQIVDVMGRILVSTDTTRNVSTNGLTAGVYVLRLINGDDVRVQKIVVR